MWSIYCGDGCFAQSYIITGQTTDASNNYFYAAQHYRVPYKKSKEPQTILPWNNLDLNTDVKDFNYYRKKSKSYKFSTISDTKYAKRK